MKDYTSKIIHLLGDLRQQIGLPDGAMFNSKDLAERIDAAAAELGGERLSWMAFRERIHRATVALAGPSYPVRLREELIRDLRAPLEHGRLPDEVSAQIRHAEQMAALKRIRKDTAMLTVHTVQCWVDPAAASNRLVDLHPKKCAYHPTVPWPHDLCPVHRAYLGLGKDERFTPPPWFKQ